MSDLTLSIDEFTDQLAEVGIQIFAPVELDSVVVIRGPDGDYGVVAVHRDGELLVIDLGHRLEHGGEHHAD